MIQLFQIFIYKSHSFIHLFIYSTYVLFIALIYLCIFKPFLGYIRTYVMKNFKVQITISYFLK